MKIYFVRHGKKHKTFESNEDGYPDHLLTDIGEIQADLAGQILSKVSFDAIFASDLKRAIRTAEIISKYQKQQKIQLDKRLREINMGAFHKMTEEKVAIHYPEFYKQYQKKEIDFTYPGGESGEDVKVRILEFLDSLDKSELEHICVVCHGGVIRSIIGHFLGLPQYNRFNINPNNCGISVAEYDPSREAYRVVSVNETLHLQNYLTL